MNLRRLLKVRRKREVIYPEFCPNCYHSLNGKYCSNCGQSVRDFHRPFWSVIKDVVGDLAAFDNRLVRTLVPLLINPGKLTHEFMRGRRVRYMPPFKMYLFLTFFAFFLLSYNHKPDPLENGEGQLAFKSSSGEVVDFEGIFSQLDNEEEKTDSLRSDTLHTDTVKLSENVSLSALDTRELKENEEMEEDESNVNQDIKGKIKKVIELYKLNPGIVIDNAFKKLSQTLFAILPLFAFMLWLLYIRRRRYFLEHLLISVNFHSYIFLIVILSELLLMIHWNVTSSLAIYLYLSIPIRLFLGLKLYYKQGWIKTFFKFVMLSFLYNILVLSGLGYSLITLAE